MAQGWTPQQSDIEEEDRTPSFVNQTLEWLSGDVKNRRADFFKSFCSLFPDVEFKNIKTMLHHATRTRASFNKRRTESVSQEQSVKRQKTEDPPQLSEVVLSPSVKPLVFLPTKDNCWWSQFKVQDIVSLDIEFVMKPVNPKECKSKTFHKDGLQNVTFTSTVNRKLVYKPHVGTVSIHWFNITNNKYEELLNCQVKHERFSYLVNGFSFKTNGFKCDSFVEGEEESNVLHKVLSTIGSKLIITCGGTNDFLALGMTPALLYRFDLQWHFTRTNEKNGSKIPHKLKNLVRHYIDKEFQKGTHDVATDSLMTLRIFYEVYVHLKSEYLDMKQEEVVFNEIEIY